MKRRDFLAASVVGTLTSPAGVCAEAVPNAAEQPAAESPPVEDNDVVVCGGGPAGVAAAIAAGRQGARVRLIELQGCLGGVWTAGMVNLVLDRRDKPSILAEILAELSKTPTQRRAEIFDVEAMKFVLEKLCRRANVGLLYHSRAVAAVKNADNRLTHVVVENKSGRQAFAAKTFVDATGDGDVAAQAGCGFSWGHPSSGKTQPMSMIALLGGLRYGELNALRVVRGDGVASAESKTVFLAELRRAGVEPSYQGPTLFPVRNDLFAMMANHQYGASGIDAQQVTDATVAGRAEIHTIVDALRRLGGPWRDIQLLATSSHIGVREGRRIHGRYTVTKDDLIRGARFDDGVCRATFGVDVHALDPDHAGGQYSSEGIRVQPYDIPLRALVARDVDGLLLAGRCISGDFFAHASYRVTGNAVTMGEAAGTTAALAAASNRLPHQIGIDALRMRS